MYIKNFDIFIQLLESFLHVNELILFLLISPLVYFYIRIHVLAWAEFEVCLLYF